MSSMRNAIDRRVHRERAQPLERRRLGLLEKHKDYSKRAQDYNKKKAQLKSLRAKAAERNEDEFYFGMMSRKGPGARIKVGKSWDGTVQGDRGNKVLDMDTARLLKTQDMGYIRTMKQVATKELAKLEEQIVMTRGMDRLGEGDDEDEDGFDGFDSDEDDDEPPRKASKPKAARKIRFFDDEEAQEDAMEEHLELEEQDADKEDDGDDKKVDEQESEREKSLRRLQRQLENARKKIKVLTDAEEALEVQRAKMAKTATSGGSTRRGKKLMVRTRKR